MSDKLTHIDPSGQANMVDISDKEISKRVATASGWIALAPSTLQLIEKHEIAKGNVLTTARLAGIQSAKETSSLIPLCHQIQLQHVSVEFEIATTGIRITANVITIGRTGAEMEALTAVSVAALTIYDMCKAVDRTMTISDIRLETKTKSKP